MTPVEAEQPCANCGWAPLPGKLWPTFGSIACRWIEENCICGEGDFYGQLIELRKDQKRFLYRLYEYCPRCDYWHYNDAIRTAATGDGKTTFVAAIVTLEFAGPPILAPASPNIIVAAASFEQADLLFKIASTMLGGQDQMAKESPLCGYFDVYDTEVSFADGRPGVLRRIAAAAGTNEGGQPTFFVCDEMHEWGDEGSNKARVYTVVGKSTAKRNVLYRIPLGNGEVREFNRGPGRKLKLSTAGADIDHSLFGKMVVRARKAQKDPTLAPSLLFDAYEAPDGLNYDDPADRRIAAIAASPAAGILWNVEDRVKLYSTPGTSKNEWQRYYGNQWVDQATESWLKDHPGAWAQCRGEWEIRGDEPTVLAIDMALKRDSVAVVQVAALADERYAVTARIWYPDDGKLPHTEIWNYIKDEAIGLQDRFKGVVYDPRYFELHAQSLEEDEGLLVIQFDQSPVRMAPAVGATYDRIIAATIVHDGDDDLRRMVHAAVKKEQDRGFTLSKGRSHHHIDGAVAMCMGVWSLAQLLSERDSNVLEQIW